MRTTTRARSRARAAARLVCVGLLLGAADASAQEAPAASLLRTSAGDGVRRGFAGAVDRIVRSRLDQLEVVRVRGSVALDIAEVQLALGCVGENPECLGQVAEQLEVQALILPNLDRAGDGLVLSVARFDAATGEVRRVARRAAGNDAEPQVLDSVDGLLRELFDLPPPAEPELASSDATEATETTGDGVTGEAEPTRTEPPPTREPQLLGPVIVLGAGGATLAGGAVTGVLFLQEADAYARATDDVAESNSHRASAEDLALATNALLVAGGVVAAGGLAWVLVELLGGGDGDEENRADLIPVLGPQRAGLEVTGLLPEIR